MAKEQIIPLELQLKMAQAAKGLADFANEFKQFTGKVASEAAKAGKSFSGIFKNVDWTQLNQGLEVAGKAFNAVKGLARGTIGSMISLNAEQESYMTSFTTMLKDGDKAKALMADIRKFGAETPFEIPELAQASQSLLAFGISAEQVVPKLRSIGDIASGVGAPIGDISEIFGKAKVAGTLFAEDINQLVGRGIPVIQEFAKQLNVSEGEVKKLASEGKISFDMLDKAFQDMTSTGGQFEGMMQAQSVTYAGLMSTLNDSIGQLMQGLGGPIFAIAKDLLTQIMEVFAKWQPIIETTTQSLAQGLQPLIEGLVPVFDAIMSVLAELIPPIAELVGVLAEALKPILLLVANLLKALAPIVGALVRVIAALIVPLIPVIELLTNLIMTILEPIFPLLEAVVGLFGALAPILELLIPLITPIIEYGVKLIMLVVEPLVDAIRWIIENAAAAIEAVASIFGGGDDEIPAAATEQPSEGTTTTKVIPTGTPPPKPPPKGGGKDAAKKAKERYDLAISDLKRSEEIDLLRAKQAEATDAEIFAIQQSYREKQLAAAKKHGQTTKDLQHEISKAKIEEETRLMQQLVEVDRVHQQARDKGEIEGLRLQSNARMQLIDYVQREVESKKALFDLMANTDPLTALQQQVSYEMRLAEIEQSRLREKLRLMQEVGAEEQRQLEQRLQGENDPIKRAEMQVQLEEMKRSQSQQTADLEIQIAAKVRDAKDSADRAEIESEKIKAQLRLQGAEQVSGNLQAIFGQQKVFAIAEATMNAYQAASTTWKAYPFPWNIPLTGLALAGGMAQVANIKGTEPTMLAEGAVLGRPTFVAGEKGMEAVLPLSKFPGLVKSSMQEAFGSNGGSLINPAPREHYKADVNAIMTPKAQAKSSKAVLTRDNRRGR